MMADMRSRNIMSIPDIKLENDATSGINMVSLFPYPIISNFFFLNKIVNELLYAEKDNHCMIVSLPM